MLLENLLRLEDGVTVTAADIEALAHWDPQAVPAKEIAFTPARVLMQDFTGVPAVVDLAAMRDAMNKLGGNPEKINPLLPPNWSLTIRYRWISSARPDALAKNGEMEFERNEERYSFLRWGQKSFRGFQGGAARYRHLPSGQPGISGARGVRA